MAWIDNYRQASFRNISFYVPSHEAAGGRRTVVHEFPNSDIPYAQDMGGKAKRFRIEARIYGEDYIIGRAWCSSDLEVLPAEGQG